MDDNLVTSVDPASKEMMATKENKSDLKLPYDVDAAAKDEGKMSDKKLQNEDDKVCVNNVLELKKNCKFIAAVVLDNLSLSYISTYHSILLL